ncbi:PAS/PAC sensor signal transduction histidine kinase [Gloeothece citriformis PCC 7424]|uniref:histidine kinase n=1 Tax=Gloeothece citriformis (strain PCC 7424) TaxID=65393 RepID=B7KFP1_GLOC7|nr:ATP-binding protein [Gloeothece citriformis]ACK73366.1 PAS/PAC sensor signal transduction histidine kinase [Gloeothece citriformis PCC 7424]
MGTQTYWNKQLENTFKMSPRLLTCSPNYSNLWKDLKQPISFTHTSQSLPEHFTAKLLAYLSRFCSVSFCSVYHTHYLSFLGLSELEIKQLFTLPIPTQKTDLDADLSILAQSSFDQISNLTGENSLIRCAGFMFSQSSQAQDCRYRVKQFLGAVNYDQLVSFLSYIKFCHQWVESYPELFNETGYDCLFSLTELLKKEKALADFFPCSEQIFRQQLSHSNLGSLLSHRDQSTTLSLTDLEAWINSLLDQVFVIECESQKILFCNESFAQRVGVKKAAQVKGKTLFDCFNFPEAKAIAHHHQSVLVSGQPLQIKESFTVGKKSYYVDTLKVPLKDSNGEIYGIISLSRNITDLFESQQILLEKQGQLEAINQELEAFSYRVSHDLQAPLRVLDGFSQILLKTYESKLDEKGQYYLKRIRANCQRMGELIRSLLQLSHIGSSSLDSQSVNLSAIAAEISLQLKATEPERNVEFRIAPNLTVMGDYQLLTIVLTNLLNNAWKYTSNTEKALIEFDYCFQEDGTKAYFVRDNGAGFDMTYINKLFSAFERLHNEQEFPGHGIGLATVKRIIERHKGSVWAWGEVEKGATFYFQLP